jgi:hypothetical protein
MPIAADAVPANSISEASPNNSEVILGEIELQYEAAVFIWFPFR